MSEVPDGYRRAADGVGLVLIDPIYCPAGHPFEFGARQSIVRCEKHGTHYSWICACGQWIYRVEGAFVGSPDC